MAQVRLVGVSKNYEGKKKAVDKINLVINDKEFVVLVGPSGCGKSTTLRMLAGLEDLNEGEIYIDGILVNNLPPKSRDIAMVFQNYALYPHMTVFDNMAFGLKLRKYSRDEIKTRVTAAAKILEIEELLSRKPKQLSGGQRQRVAVGRAMVRKPKVFLFDEPLSNLDAKLRVQMRAEIKKLHQKLQATIIYVTHDQVEAMTMGDRIVVMKDGIIQQVDSPLNLYNNPVNKFVAGFIGSPSMNFISGKIIDDNGIKFVSNQNSLRVILNEFQISKLSSFINNNIIVGIRPESFSIDNITENKIVVHLEIVEQMGNESFLHFTLDGTPFIARSKPDVKCITGNEINIYLINTDLFFFNENNNERFF